MFPDIIIFAHKLEKQPYNLLAKKNNIIKRAVIYFDLRESEIIIIRKRPSEKPNLSSEKNNKLPSKQ